MLMLIIITALSRSRIKKYKEALSSFTITENAPQYKGIVPYYITEIYYFNGQKTKPLNTVKSK